LKKSQLRLCTKYDVALWKNVVEKVTRNKSTLNEFDDLAENSNRLYTAPSVGADDDVFLKFARAQANRYMMTHSALCPTDKKQGLFVHGSQINHSCMPNTARGYIGDILIVRASRTIRAGEQVFTSRTQLVDDFEQAKRLLGSTSKGHCECAICVAEQQTTP